MEIGADFHAGRQKYNFGSDYPVEQLDWDVNIDALEALNIAQSEGPASSSFHWNKDVDLVVLPWEEAGVLVYKLCWQVFSETEAPRGKWISFIDVETGELLNVYNEVRFLEGTLHAEHDTRTVDGSFSVSPLSQLNIDGTALRTEADGSYLWDTELEEVTVGFSGRRVNVTNQSGADAQFSYRRRIYCDD